MIINNYFNCRPELNILAFQPWTNLEIRQRVDQALDEVITVLYPVCNNCIESMAHGEQELVFYHHILP